MKGSSYGKLLRDRMRLRILLERRARLAQLPERLLVRILRLHPQLTLLLRARHRLRPHRLRRRQGRLRR